jgi:hypothetical protein
MVHGSAFGGDPQCTGEAVTVVAHGSWRTTHQSMGGSAAKRIGDGVRRRGATDKIGRGVERQGSRSLFITP